MYDFDDYDNPIKDFIDTKFYYNLQSGVTKEADIYVRQNFAEQSDSIFQLQSSSSESNFINVEDSLQKVRNADNNGTVFQLYFLKDSKSITYRRSVLTFLDCCGLIGGVNEILNLAGMFVVSFVSSKVFVLSLLSAIYKVNITAKNNNVDVNKFEVLYENDIGAVSRPHQHSMTPRSRNASLKLRKYVDSTANKEDIVRHASDEMRQRLRFSYSFADVIYNVLWPFKWFKLKWCKWLQSINRRYQVYASGKRKLDKELSVVAFVKMQHMLKILLRLMLNKQQRLIASYSKQNKISVSSDSNDSQSDSWSDQRIPKMLDSSNTKKEHDKTVKSFIERYSKNNLSLNDCKLLNWVFSNTDLDLKFQNISINNSHNQLENRINNIDLSQKLVSSSLNLRNLSSVKLFEKYEEQKRYSPKSSLSVCKLIQETNQGKVECFDEIDVHED